ncbi:MAG: class I SAM-dependent methyltransferase [Halanaeroarchaeum sp.]
MRRFSPEYLRDTRRGFWDDRSALDALDLADRSLTVDVGSGIGSLTSVLREESPGSVIGVDVDRTLLEADGAGPLVQGDATRLPFRDGVADLVLCQALLINLPDPAAAVAEFARVSSDLVAAIEPDNAAVSVESTVEEEASLAARLRRHYIAGVETDVTLGSSASDLFTAAGLHSVRTVRHTVRRTVGPPYTEEDLESAKRKARGTRIEEQRETLEAGGLTGSAVDRLRDRWQTMGRAVVDQMAEERYEREATIPFFVTAGRVTPGTKR